MFPSDPVYTVPQMIVLHDFAEKRHEFAEKRRQHYDMSAAMKSSKKQK